MYLRTDSKKDLPNLLKPYAIENPFVPNPLTIIDKKIVWYGEPLSDAHFISQRSVILVKSHPVFRFEGRYTATALYYHAEMNKTVDADPVLTSDNFAAFVQKNKKCRMCGNPMKLTKGKRGKFYLSCTGYPNCKETELVDVAFVEKYFFRHKGKCQSCLQCKSSLEAKIGQYGLYIRCCGDARHMYNLDQI